MEYTVAPRIIFVFVLSWIFYECNQKKMILSREVMI